MSVIAYIALGSNLGDRRANLDGALAALREHSSVQVIAVSTYHETEPVGGPAGQATFLNAAAKLETTLSPEELLELLLEIEQRFGRRRSEPNAPRTLDLDLLLYGDLERAAPDPVIPHPRMWRRSFVVDPLAEIAADVRHPALGVTIRRLSENLKPPPPGRPLAGLRTLVTGSTSGIGRAIAEAFAEAGAWVIVHGRRNPDRAQEVADSLRRHDVATAVKMADLSDWEAAFLFAGEAWYHWDGLDVLVCNAGADTLTGAARDWSFIQKLEALWAVDVRGTMVVARSIGDNMADEINGGSIITMGWDQAETGMDGDSGQLFAATKGAVMGFTRSLAMTLAPRVSVNCIAPGWIKTAWGETASSEWHERVLRETPMGRWGTAEDVAAAARWLASREARFITGQIIRINGGAVR